MGRGRIAHIKYEYKGKLRTIKELMAFSVVSESVFRYRVRDGFSVYDALHMSSENYKSRQKNCNPTDENKDKSNNINKRYVSTVTSASIKKGATNKKLEDLIEKRLLEKEIEDF